MLRRDHNGLALALLALIALGALALWIQLGPTLSLTWLPFCS